MSDRVRTHWQALLAVRMCRRRAAHWSSTGRRALLEEQSAQSALSGLRPVALFQNGTSDSLHVVMMLKTVTAVQAAPFEPPMPQPTCVEYPARGGVRHCAGCTVCGSQLESKYHGRQSEATITQDEAHKTKKPGRDSVLLLRFALPVGLHLPACLARRPLHFCGICLSSRCKN